MQLSGPTCARVRSLGAVSHASRLTTAAFPCDNKAARNRWVPGRFSEMCCGGVLLSHNLSVAVPLALPGLASRFEMLLGVSPVL